MRRADLEGAPVRIGDRVGIEQVTGQDVAGEQGILGGPARPRSRVHPEQPHERPRRRDEMACGTPDGRGARIATIRQAQVLQ